MPSEKQIEAAAKAMETLALEQGFVPWDEAASVALTAAEQAEPAPAAEAVAWVAADTLNSPHPGCVSSLAYMSQIDKDMGREYVPLYTRPPESRLREARLREALANLVQEIDDLVSESEGVAGLHLNGDVAEWDDLLPGGPYERLTSLDDARAALKAAMEAGR